MSRMVPGGPHTAPRMVQGTNYSATDGPGPLLGGGGGGGGGTTYGVTAMLLPREVAILPICDFE